MSALRFLIPATISEFEVLRDLGAFQGEASRLIVISSGPDSLERREVHEQLLAKMPELRPGEDHSILVLSFTAYQAGHAGGGDLVPAGKLRFEVGHCDAVYPLTRRAGEILRGRYEGQVKLAEPVFEAAVARQLTWLESASSRAGALALVDALVENRHEFDPGLLQHALEKGPEAVSALLRAVLNFTRYKAMPAEPVSGLRDLGTLLKQSDPASGRQQTALVGLADWLRAKQETATGFNAIHRDARLAAVLEEISGAWELPLHAAGLALFFHWRELALRARGIDFSGLESDCRDLAGYVDGQRVTDALWLLGYSAGFEAISRGYYNRLERNHPFNTGGQPGRKVSFLRVKSLEPEPRSDENAAGRGEAGGGSSDSEAGSSTVEKEQEASAKKGDDAPPDTNVPEPRPEQPAPSPDESAAPDPGEVPEPPALPEGIEAGSAGGDTAPSGTPHPPAVDANEGNLAAEVQVEITEAKPDEVPDEPVPLPQEKTPRGASPQATPAKTPASKKGKSKGKGKKESGSSPVDELFPDGLTD
jgi:hypothetical protein